MRGKTSCFSAVSESKEEEEEEETEPVAIYKVIRHLICKWKFRGAEAADKL